MLVSDGFKSVDIERRMSTPDSETMTHTNEESESQQALNSEEQCSETSECSNESNEESKIEISETSSIAVSVGASSSTTHMTSSTTTNRTTQSKRERRERSSHNLMRYQKHILRLTNSIRAEHEVPPLTLHPALNEAARLHNADIALVIKDLSHVSSDGKTLTERLLNQGYDFRYASENLARGQRDCRWVMKSWMKSPGHKRNILSERVREMGLHVGIGDGKMYWCQVFGIRRGES